MTERFRFDESAFQSAQETAGRKLYDELGAEISLYAEAAVEFGQTLGAGHPVRSMVASMLAVIDTLIEAGKLQLVNDHDGGLE